MEVDKRIIDARVKMKQLSREIETAGLFFVGVVGLINELEGGMAEFQFGVEINADDTEKDYAIELLIEGEDYKDDPEFGNVQPGAVKG